MDNFKIGHIAHTTIKDVTHLLCKSLKDSQDQERDKILQTYNFNTKTALPLDIEHYSQLCDAAPKTMNCSKLAQAIKDFNAGSSSHLNDKECTIRTLRFINTMEESKEQSVAISIDEVGVKKQNYIRDRSTVTLQKK